MEAMATKSATAEKTMTNRRRSARDRKLALLRDVDNLKKKLRHEENVHRALERAFNRPLGALPRLPPYLPKYTLELLAEVAVLEEEVVLLEKQIANFRQGLYREAAYISSTKSSENTTPHSNKELSVGSSKRGHSRSSSQSEVTFGSLQTRPRRSLSPSFSRVASIKRIMFSEHVPETSVDSCKDSKPNTRNKSLETKSTCKRHLSKPDLTPKSVSSRKMQCRIVEQAQETSLGSLDRVVDAEYEANKLSEDILNCLINIFVRLSSSKGKTVVDLESFSSLAAKSSSGNDEELNFRDPYCTLSESKTRDIGTYKYLYAIEVGSIDLKQKTNASFLIQRLKILLDKLSSVRLDGLSHQQKLAFWINIYNACIMNVSHLRIYSATINVGKHMLNAVMIEHLILRLPYHLKYVSCRFFPCTYLRVYTATQIESELEAAKRDYLQAAVFVSFSDKIVITKLLDWYLLDFAKDLDLLLDWICMQLPDKVKDDAVKCLERKVKEPLSNLMQVMPYNFSFRYLIHR
ncbi:Protein of unknown function- DUF547 [Striga hermonthica]|uniref:Ternary complex factor MIP1 leucine-zipper domain-containing protein n=1 Tax=Striga hermonthica TaxID=68872 RepID=A0A9N7RJY8_STRHE|nr:Protein of unknown function- DUF547 [Striga hermonthica]